MAWQTKRNFSYAGRHNTGVSCLLCACCSHAESTRETKKDVQRGSRGLSVTVTEGTFFQGSCCFQTQTASEAEQRICEFSVLCTFWSNARHSDSARLQLHATKFEKKVFELLCLSSHRARLCMATEAAAFCTIGIPSILNAVFDHQPIRVGGLRLGHESFTNLLQHDAVIEFVSSLIGHCKCHYPT